MQQPISSLPYAMLIGRENKTNMKNQHLLIALLAMGLLCCNGPSPNSNSGAVLNEEEVERVVLLGGTLISGMEQYAFFERAMLQQYHDISFRNIGWPADDVYGLARSQFGSAQNTRSWQPPTAEEGFGSKVMMDHLAEAAPTTLIIGFGAETAYAQNEDELALFKSGYERLLNFSEDLGATLILLTPPKHEIALLDEDILTQQNQWLGKAADFIRTEAESRGHHCIDLYDQLVTDPQGKNFTKNGVQLNEKGYQQLAHVLLAELGLESNPAWHIELDQAGQVVNPRGRRYY